MTDKPVPPPLNSMKGYQSSALKFSIFSVFPTVVVIVNGVRIGIIICGVFETFSADDWYPFIEFRGGSTGLSVIRQGLLPTLLLFLGDGLLGVVMPCPHNSGVDEINVFKGNLDSTFS